MFFITIVTVVITSRVEIIVSYYENTHIVITYSCELTIRIMFGVTRLRCFLLYFYTFIIFFLFFFLFLFLLFIIIFLDTILKECLSKPDTLITINARISLITITFVINTQTMSITVI